MSTDQYPGARTLLRVKLPSVPGAGSANAAGFSQCSASSCRRTGSSSTWSTRWFWMPVNARSWPGDDVQRLPERALKMPEMRQSENAHAQRAVGQLRRLHAGDEDADVRPILIAQAAIEVGIVGIGVAVGNLREPAGLERRDRRSSATPCSCR